MTQPTSHRRRVLLRSLLAASAGVPLVSMAQSTPVLSESDLAHAVTLRDAGLKTSLAYDLMASLVREVGPRPAGSPGDAMAVAWAQSHLRRLGFANVRADPVPLTVWQRGATTVEVTAPEKRAVVAVALGNTVGTAEPGIEAEIAWYPDFQALRADSSDKARGRIVFIDQKMDRSRDGSGYGRAVLARVAGAVEAARRGALAVAIRSIGTDRDQIAHTGAMRYDPQVAQIPAVAVGVPDADWMAERVAAGQALRMRVHMARVPQLRAVTHNVIGEVPGTDLANEVVLLGAHLDTWDITPGAQDDASGVGIVMAAAKVLLDAGRQPRRTVRVVLFGNEENGFDGARDYGQRYQAQPHQLLGESDFGADRIWRFRARVRPEAQPVIDAMSRVLAPLGIEADGQPGNPSPDASVLMRMRNWPAVELTQDGTRYFDVHHTVNDTVERVDPSTMPQNVAAWAAVAWLAAQAGVAFGPIELTR